MKTLNDHLFQGLIAELLGDSFSRDRGFHLKDLETVCSEVALESPLFPENHGEGDPRSEQAGLERIKSLLCLILSHLELSGGDELPPGELSGFLSPSVPVTSTQCHFMNMARWLKELKASHTEKTELTQLNKMIGLNICLAMEDQISRALLRPLELFWPHKDQIIRSCIVVRNQKTSLSENWLNTLNRHLKAEEGFSSSQELSRLFLDCFRSLASSPSRESVTLPLSQLATLVLLLGLQARALHLSEIETSDLSFLLLRMDHLKKEACSSDLSLTENWLTEVEQMGASIQALIFRINDPLAAEKLAA